MKHGDRVQVIEPEDLMFGLIGTFYDLTSEGEIVVRFPTDLGGPGNHLDVPYHPQSLELAPQTLWEFAGISGTLAA